MKHALITQFAVRYPKGHVRRKWEQREGWLDYRIELFDKYCLPSVQAQTFKDFEWWLLIDYTIPGLESRHISHLRQHANIVWVEEPTVSGTVNEGKLLSGVYKDEWVCSTRLDSDDILRNDFMQILSENIDESPAWITFKHGYMLRNGEVAPRQYTRNPFVSHVEYADPFRGVYSVGHKQVHIQDAPLKIIETPGWIQVDHADNVKNLVSRKMKNFDAERIDPATLYNDFTWNR